MRASLVRLGWFMGIWLASVVGLGIVSYVLRLWLK